MLVIFGLILVALIAIVGGRQRSDVSNCIGREPAYSVHCDLAYCQRSTGFSSDDLSQCGYLLHYVVLPKRNKPKNAICVYGSAYYNIHFVFCNWH